MSPKKTSGKRKGKASAAAAAAPEAAPRPAAPEPEPLPGPPPTGRELAVLILLPAVMLLPFLNKAYHVDDPLFVWTAQHLLEEPVNFYGFNTNWSYTETPIFEIMQNPPLLSYYLAPFGWLFGWGEPILHLAMLLPTVLASLGAYHVARRFCRRPMLAALIMIVSPAFLVSSSQVMSDVPMVALWLWAIHFWCVALDRNSMAHAVFAALLVTAAVLTKYFAMSLIPLLTAYTLLHGKERMRLLGAWLAPAVILLGYEFMTNRLYGRGLLFDAGSYARFYRADEGATLHGKTFNVIVFTGACLAPALLFLPWLWRARRAFALAGLFIGLVTLVQVLFPERSMLGVVFQLNFDEPGRGVYGSHSAAPSWHEKLQWSLWLFAGLHVIALILLDLARNRDRQSLFLTLWFGGTMFFCAYVNHMVNARVILPLALAVGIVAARQLDLRHLSPPRALWHWRAPLVPACALALLLTYVDYALAGSARQAARDIMSREHAGRVWFSGHSGFQYYMEELGARSIDRQRSIAVHDDSYVLPSNNWFPIPVGPHLVGSYELLEYRTPKWVATSHPEAYAGFYSDKAGPLPFTFTRVEPERYLVVRLAHPEGFLDPDR